MPTRRFAIAVSLVFAFASLAFAQARTDVFNAADETTTLVEVRPNDDGGYTVVGYSVLNSADGGSSISFNASCQATNATQRARAAAALDFGERCALRAARVGAGTLP